MNQTNGYNGWYLYEGRGDSVRRWYYYVDGLIMATLWRDVRLYPDHWRATTGGIACIRERIEYITTDLAEMQYHAEMMVRLRILEGSIRVDR